MKKQVHDFSGYLKTMAIYIYLYIVEFLKIPENNFSSKNQSIGTFKNSRKAFF